MTMAQRASAARMLAAKGQSVTITSRSAGAYDPATGSATIAETTQASKGVVLPLSGRRKVDGSTIVASDETFLLSALKADGTPLAAPKVNDTVTLADGSKLTLTVVDPLHPAGLDILFDCVVRGHG